MPTENRIAGGIVAIFLNLSRREYRKDEDRLLDSRGRSFGGLREHFARRPAARGLSVATENLKPRSVKVEKCLSIVLAWAC